MSVTSVRVKTDIMCILLRKSPQLEYSEHWLSLSGRSLEGRTMTLLTLWLVGTSLFLVMFFSCLVNGRACFVDDDTTHALGKCLDEFLCGCNSTFMSSSELRFGVAMYT